MSKLSKPRHGSLGFLPRKKAEKPYFSARSWIRKDGKVLLGFAGYKAGMTQLFAVDKRKNSPSFETTLAIAGTIIECPPIHVFGIRGYSKTVYGINPMGDIWEQKTSKNLARKMSVPKKPQEKVPDLSTASEIRLLVHTQPTFKKKPEVFEIGVNGDTAKALEYAKSVLGKDVKVTDVIAKGDLVDVIAVTKGHGKTGPTKRWGSRIQYRKAHGKRRHVGTMGPITPRRMMWTALQGGQMGFHRRTENNKYVLKVGDNGAEVTPSGGIVNFGNVEGDYIILQGSVPGPKKRAVMMRFAARPQKKQPEAPELTEISTVTQQGRTKA
jgi:large subunit ribosomal protein L3